jgi:hypothetical protein
MAVAEVAAALPAQPERARRRWRYQHCLALFALAVLIYETWGWTSYWLSGPVQITKYRDTSDISWYVACIYEALSVCTLVGVGGWVLRKVLRERRLGIEAMFCIAGFFTYWNDPMSNFVQPLFFNSSNWINLNEWTGNFPLVRNPDAGRMPEPVLFGLPLYLTGFLAFALILSYLLRRIRNRWPGLGWFQLILCAVGLGVLIDVALEVPMYLVGLWAYPGQPSLGLFAGTGHRYPVTEALAGGLFFGVLTAMIFFRDDRGRTVMEQGLDHLNTRRRTALTLLALIGVFNLAYGIDNAWWVAWGLDSTAYHHMAPSTVAGMCDAPGISHTRYGACPGSPGYRLPLPGDLRGPKPGGNGALLNGPRPCVGCAPVVVDRELARR